MAWLSLGVALGESDSALLIEKTFPRDNAVCYVNGQRLEVVLRGSNKFTEPREARYGELLFYTLKKGKKELSLLPFNKGRIDTYRFFAGKDPQSLCTRAQGHLVGKNKFALLFQKENHPLQGKLTVQYFDAKTLAPLDFAETDYLSDKAISTPQGFAFNSHQERLNVEMGKLKIDEEEYTFQDRPFPIWIEVSAKGTATSLSLTYENFPLKRFFKDVGDFNKLANWDGKEKLYKNSVIYLAVNHSLKKECILLVPKALSLDGSEAWRCRQLE